MSRSVDYLTNASLIAYRYIDNETEWDFLEDDIVDFLMEKFPSLIKCQRWDGREVKIILENQFTEIGISEYNGIVSISIRPTTSLGENWINKIKETFLKVGTMNHMATFSNGEAMFIENTTDNPAYVSSKEGICEWM